MSLLVRFRVLLLSSDSHKTLDYNKHMITPEEVREKRLDRLDELKDSVTAIRIDCEELLNHMQLFNFSERQQEVVRRAYGRKVHDVNSEISSIKKKMGLPSQREVKIERKKND
jgi:hypothetical protein